MMKIYRYGEVSNDEIFARPDMKTGVSDVVADIIANVRAKGDEALFEYCRKFDQADLDTLEVSEAEIDEAFDVVGDFRRVLERAAANIRKFHEKQLRNS
ncbi:MAG: histidinol dehydrogenase, partial [Acutalibacteraceae bacterium]|nr:histidinol dehydrogenase [Acutalibacteraceae bacterium]